MQGYQRMSEYSIIPFSSELREIWDNIVNKSKNGNFLHLRNYLNYHLNRFDEKSTIIFRGNKPVAIFPCNKVDGQIISHAGLTYAGLIYGSDIKAIDVLNIFQLLTRHYIKLDCNSIIYKAIPHIFHRMPAEEDLYALFRLDAKLIRRDLSTVVLMSDRIKLSDSRKNIIRRADNFGLKNIEGNFFNEFHGLLTEVLRKYDAIPVHGLDEIIALKNYFPDRIRLFGAFQGSELLAGAIVYDFGNVAHTQYLASSEIGKQVGALDFLLAHLLADVFQDRKYFSFGISTEKNGRYVNEGLLFQKEGFGGRGLCHDFYELNLDKLCR